MTDIDFKYGDINPSWKKFTDNIELEFVNTHDWYLVPNVSQAIVILCSKCGVYMTYLDEWRYNHGSGFIAPVSCQKYQEIINIRQALE